MILMTGCGLVTVEVTGIRSDGCAWVSPLYLTEASINALRNAQKIDPMVRIDRENIVRHNRLYETFCPEEQPEEVPTKIEEKTEEKQ